MTVEEYAEEQKKLRKLLLNKGTFEQGQALCLTQNAALHESDRTGQLTFMDTLVNGLSRNAFAFRPPAEFETIAWCIWHITRIEDAIGSILIADDAQVFTAEWKDKIQSDISDTANAFTVQDVDTFSAKVDLETLFAYRRAVGKHSQKIIHSVDFISQKQKPTAAAIERIMKEGVLTMEEKSLWLKDFWANKSIGGLLLLPMTRHQMMHIPNCLRLKELSQHTA